MDYPLRKVNIRAFRADKNKEDCLRYVDGHRKVLETYGVTHVTSANLNWMHEPYTYVILVEASDSGEILGGGRVQLADSALPLPIETAINDLDTRIFDMVKEKAKRGTGEYCGLWNSRKIAGYGIGSVVLVRIGIAILNQLRVDSLFAFCSPATVPISMSVGYRIITSLGNEGTFYYPKEDLLATALILEDPLELKFADPQERRNILELRNNPVRTTTEKGRKGEIEVSYDLRIAPVGIPIISTI